MKRNRFRLILFLAAALAASRSASAQHIIFAGVLGNSGEQGSSLVRFASPAAQGMGVIYDSYGTIWDRAGSGRLNRYALDGRLLASYAIPAGNSRADRQTLANGNIVMLLGGKLYRLPLDALAQAQPIALNIMASKMSFANRAGDVAVLQGATVKVLNPNNWALTTAISPVSLVSDLYLLDDGSIAIRTGATIRLYRNGSEVTAGWPQTSSESLLENIAGVWYGLGYHGTVGRFDQSLQPAPGVVLGGKTGAFLGHIDGNEELSLGNGLALISDTTAAVSGQLGIVSLLEWDDAISQYHIMRRLGAVTNCNGLAINDAGSVWFNSGRWNWGDLPTSPLLDSIPGVDAVGQVALLNDGSFVAAAQSGATVTLLHDQFDWRNQLANGIKLPPAMLNAATTYALDGKTRVFLLADASGQASSFILGANNIPQTSPTPVALRFASPVRQLTTLAMKNDSVMLAAVDGAIGELELRGGDWQEIKRWNSWGAGDSDRFGGQIYIAADGNRLWVSDAARNRVLCFDLESGKLLGSFGEVDRAGDDLQHLSHPAAVAAHNGRAVVFDSENQRIVKLQWSGS